MDLDQIEYAYWSPPERKSSTGSLRGAHALKCSRIAFVRTGRSYGYAKGGPSPKEGAVAEPREEWLQEPRATLWIDEWVEGYVGHMPKGNQLPPPPPAGPPPSRGAPGNTASPGGAPSSSGDRSSWRGAGFPAPGGTPSEAAQSSRGHAQQGAAPAQERYRPQVYQAPPDLRDKYLISYSESQEVPHPHPGRDTVIFKVLADGSTKFDCYIPFTRNIAKCVETL